MSRPERVYRGLTLALSVAILGFGVAILIATFAAGGGPASIGFLLGLLFCGIGAARLYLAVRAGR